MGPSIGAKGNRSLDQARAKAPISLDQFVAAFLADYSLNSEKERAELSPWISVEIRERLGIERLRMLGQGSYAIAGIVDGTERDVLKLTTDPRETAAGLRLAGKKLDHVARILSAGETAIEIQSREELRPIHAGVLVQEGVDWVGLETREEDALLSRIVYDVENELGIFHERVRGRRAERMRVLITGSIEIRNRLYSQGGNLRQIAEGLGELHDEQVFVVDVHYGNVGFSEKDRAFKIFDLGYSVVAGGDPIDV